MTNSAKQTKKATKGKAAPKAQAQGKAAPKLKVGPSVGGLPEVSVPSYATSDFWSGAAMKRPALLLGVFALVLGWAFILHINRWHFTVPVFMLWMGWAGVIATARFLWWAGIAMASDLTADSHEIDLSAARLRELREEKKVLLRAIKEIEFDRDLGKMSAADATEIMRFYRARAIEVIKEIDGQSDDDLTVPQRIERDLQVRLAVATQRRPSATDTPAQKAARIVTARANAKLAAEAKAKAELDDKANAEASSDEASSDEASSDEASSDEAIKKTNNETPASDEDDETEAAESA